MAMGKRVFFFLLTNILILTLVNIIITALGIGPQLTQYGLNYANLAVTCLLWGMVGSFISLAMSRFMAKRMTGMRIVDISTESNPRLRDVAKKVNQLSAKAGLKKMPEVGVYTSPEVNAFATGPTKNRSLVAVSTGLLDKMSDDQVEGVLAHEIAHVANGDMVTMTLLQGVINAFVLFLSRIAAYAIANMMRGDREGATMSQGIYFMTTIVFQIVFGILGSIVVNWFSRHREFKADIGGARYAGKQKMIEALQSLANSHPVEAQPQQAALANFKISATKSAGFRALFSTHPPLELRIQRLKERMAF